MVRACPLPNPCPQLFRTIFRPFVLGESVELATANRTRVALMRPRGFRLWGERKRRFVVIQRINAYVAASLQLYPEYGGLALQVLGMHFALAPSAAVFIVHHFYVPLVRGEEQDFFLRHIFFSQEFAVVIVVDRYESIAMVRYLRCSVCGEIETEAEENLRTLLQFIFIRYFVDAELLAADGALLASVSQSIELRSRPTRRAQ